MPQVKVGEKRTVPEAMAHPWMCQTNISNDLTYVLRCQMLSTKTNMPSAKRVSGRIVSGEKHTQRMQTLRFVHEFQLEHVDL